MVDMFKNTALRGWKEKKKCTTPCSIRTHDSLVTRRTLFCCATTPTRGYQLNLTIKARGTFDITCC